MPEYQEGIDPGSVSRCPALPLGLGQEETSIEPTRFPSSESLEKGVGSAVFAVVRSPEVLYWVFSRGLPTFPHLALLIRSSSTISLHFGPVGILVFCCCVTNHHKLSSLKHYLTASLGQESGHSVAWPSYS